LIEIDWPEFGVATCPPPPPSSELEARIDTLRAEHDWPLNVRFGAQRKPYPISIEPANDRGLI